MLENSQEIIQHLIELNCLRTKGIWTYNADTGIVDQDGNKVVLFDPNNLRFILAIVNISTEILDYCLELEVRSTDLRERCNKLKDTLELQDRLKRKQTPRHTTRFNQPASPENPKKDKRW